ncbi:hypothetical protein [Escherichia coli]|nr:hypothetical protein [Escherichia coli]GDV00495.1 transposase [Escherichia coli]
MKYTPVGVDIAKHVIQVHFINECQRRMKSGSSATWVEENG